MRPGTENDSVVEQHSKEDVGLLNLLRIGLVVASGEIVGANHCTSIS